uniref:Uncharacterized protein n=1 Tax=Rousettus aegyptiacus TaxID=9407 RepID=A0A7J8BEU1_ROUAE|nr:hypothetical protein HJG63_009686 [Rousettus aegyptiacus]
MTFPPSSGPCPELRSVLAVEGREGWRGRERGRTNFQRQCGRRNGLGIHFGPKVLFLHGVASRGDRPSPLVGSFPSQGAPCHPHRSALFHWPVHTGPSGPCGSICHPPLTAGPSAGWDFAGPPSHRPRWPSCWVPGSASPF